MPGPEWLRRRRAEAFDRFSAADLPTEAEEVWRYSRIDDLDLDSYEPVVPAGAFSGDGRPASLPGGAADLVEALGGYSALVVVEGGRVVVADGAGAPGLTVAPLTEAAAGEVVFGSVAGSADAFFDLATAFADGVIVDVAPRAVVERPVVVVTVASGTGSALFPRTSVRLGSQAEARVVEIAVSSDDDLLTGPVTELDVGDGAHLRYVSIQRAGRAAWQLGYQASRVGRDGSLHSFAVALGGGYARVRTDSRLVGQGASSRLRALYFGDGGRMHDFRTLQDHDAPRTTSDLLFKGAVRDHARGVYSGLIRVRKGAAGTNAFQTNRNLVLSDGAHADSVPNLEIEDNDVRCSHASAVGPVDEEQRYYLESRGVPPDVADRLIVLGFFDELLADLPVDGLRAPLRAAVSRVAAAPPAPRPDEGDD